MSRPFNSLADTPSAKLSKESIAFSRPGRAQRDRKTTFPRLLEDIYAVLFEILEDDKQSLLALTPVCRLFRILGQRRLFSNIVLESQYGLDTALPIPPGCCIRLEALLRANPNLALNVRTIQLRQHNRAPAEPRRVNRPFLSSNSHFPWITKNGPFLAHLLRLLSKGRITALSFYSSYLCSWEDFDQQLHHALLCILREPHFERLSLVGLINVPFTLLYQCSNIRQLELSDPTFSLNFSMNPQIYALISSKFSLPRLSRLRVTLQPNNQSSILQLLETGFGLDLTCLEYMRLNIFNSLPQGLQTTNLSSLSQLHIHYEGSVQSIRGLETALANLKSLSSLTLSIDGSAQSRGASFPWLISAISSLSPRSPSTLRELHIGIIINSSWFPTGGLDLLRTLSNPLSDLFLQQNRSSGDRLQKVIIAISIRQVRSAIVPLLVSFIRPLVAWKGCKVEMLEIKIVDDGWFK